MGLCQQKENPSRNTLFLSLVILVFMSACAEPAEVDVQGPIVSGESSKPSTREREGVESPAPSPATRGEIDPLCQPDEACVETRVTDAHTRQPVQAFTVCRGFQGSEVSQCDPETKDREGRAKLLLEKGSQLTIWVTAAQYMESVRAHVTVPPARVLSFEIPPHTCIISGDALRSDGSPAQSVLVTAQDSRALSQDTTGEMGTFAIPVGHGRWQVAICVRASSFGGCDQGGEHRLVVDCPPPGSRIRLKLTKSDEQLLFPRG